MTKRLDGLSEKYYGPRERVRILETTPMTTLVSGGAFAVDPEDFPETVHVIKTARLGTVLATIVIHGGKVFLEEQDGRLSIRDPGAFSVIGAASIVRKADGPDVAPIHAHISYDEKTGMVMVVKQVGEEIPGLKIESADLEDDILKERLDEIACSNDPIERIGLQGAEIIYEKPEVEEAPVEGFLVRIVTKIKTLLHL